MHLRCIIRVVRFTTKSICSHVNSVHACIAGTLDDWFGVNAFRVTQTDPDTIFFEVVLWTTLTSGLPPPLQLASAERYFAALHSRVQQALDDTSFPPATGDECDAGMDPAGGGYGELGSAGY